MPRTRRLGVTAGQQACAFTQCYVSDVQAEQYAQSRAGRVVGLDEPTYIEKAAYSFGASGSCCGSVVAFEQTVVVSLIPLRPGGSKVCIFLV